MDKSFDNNLNIETLAELDLNILTLSFHPGIVQAVLDFDYLVDKDRPSVVAAIGSGRKYQRLFWGMKEVMIPVFPNVESLPVELKSKINAVLNFASGRRALSALEQAAPVLPELKLVNVFAEELPELHAQKLIRLADEKELAILGPASIGILIPGKLKLGAIAGVQARQLLETGVTEQRGEVAVFSASGGMTNEIISIVAQTGRGVSFSLSFGGDRFPVVDPEQAFLAAESDPLTKEIAYYGELGGVDEYKIVELIESGVVTKPVVAYIAGTVSEMFETPPQFGHAKAMAGSQNESATAKRKALSKAGVKVAESFSQFGELLGAEEPLDKKSSQGIKLDPDQKSRLSQLEARRPTLFTSTISKENTGETEILGQPITEITKKTLGNIVAEITLGRKLQSTTTAEFIELVLKLFVDNGPYQSGPVNTMVTARAGKDLASGVAAGVLAIGPRFGGAINEAAANWAGAVERGADPTEFVEEFASQRKLILGIGHKRYRSDFPDPRVEKVIGFAKNLSTTPHLDFALAVESITTAKKANLILNMDGVVAAMLLDIFTFEEKLSASEISELVEIEYFNSLFVISRTIGLTAHYLDQRRLDEGLFRLSPDQVGGVN